MSDETRVRFRLNEGQRQRERQPAEQREEKHGLPAAPALGHVAPERHRDQLDERPETHQHPGLGRVQPELLEVDADQREQRPTRSEQVGLSKQEVFNCTYQTYSIHPQLFLMLSYRLAFYCDICIVSLKYFFYLRHFKLNFFTLLWRLPPPQ